MWKTFPSLYFQDRNLQSSFCSLVDFGLPFLLCASQSCHFCTQCCYSYILWKETKRIVHKNSFMENLPGQSFPIFYPATLMSSMRYFLFFFSLPCIFMFYFFSWAEIGRAKKKNTESPKVPKKKMLEHAVLDPCKHEHAHITPTVLGTQLIMLFPTPVGKKKKKKKRTHTSFKDSTHSFASYSVFGFDIQVCVSFPSRKKNTKQGLSDCNVQSFSDSTYLVLKRNFCFNRHTNLLFQCMKYKITKMVVQSFSFTT